LDESPASQFVNNLAIYIDPPSHHFHNDRLFAPGAAALTGDNMHAPWIAVRDHFGARGIPVHTGDLLVGASASQQKVYFSAGMLDNYRRIASRADIIVSAFMAFECPVVEPKPYREFPRLSKAFRHILTWSDSESLLPFTGRLVPCERFQWPQSSDCVHEQIWSRRDRGFLVMINANKLPRLYWQELYTARLQAIEYFHRYREIDLYGPGWERMPSRVGASVVPMAVRRLYRTSGAELALWQLKQRVAPNPLYAAAAAASRGVAKSKSETLGRYTFALCFENMRIKGWMTEKIFDCFFAGTVPVYWGATDVTDWVPPEAFIDMRAFRDYAELRSFLRSLARRDIERYRDTARAYIESAAFDPFRKRAFVDVFRRLVRQDTGVDV
jgi:hypothetical protein